MSIYMMYFSLISIVALIVFVKYGRLIATIIKCEIEIFSMYFPYCELLKQYLKEGKYNEDQLKQLNEYLDGLLGNPILRKLLAPSITKSTILIAKESEKWTSQEFIIETLKKLM